MSSKESWSKYRLALPVFLCLVVAGFIIAALLRANSRAGRSMETVNASKGSFSQTTTAHADTPPPPSTSDTTRRRTTEATVSTASRHSRTTKMTTGRPSRTTTAKTTKHTTLKTTRSTADLAELYRKKLEELRKEYEEKQERVQNKLIDLEIQKEIDLAALDQQYTAAGLLHSGAYEVERNRIDNQYEREAAACRQQGEEWRREYEDKVRKLKEQYGQP